MGKSKRENNIPDKKPEKLKSQFNINRITPGFNLVEIPGMRERRERDWKTFYELHENDFVKTMREINGLSQEAQWEALNNFLKKAYSLKKYAEINPESPLNPTALISKLEKEVFVRIQKQKKTAPLPINQIKPTFLRKWRQSEWLLDRFIGETKIFALFLKQLAFKDNSFIYQESAANYQLIYENQFHNENFECGTDKQMKINWKTPWPVYHYFYSLIKDNEVFRTNKGCGEFFEAHFLYHGEERDHDSVNKGTHGNNPSEKIKKKLDSIFSNIFKKSKYTP